MRVPSRYLRPVVQAAFFAGFALLFLNLSYPVSMPLSNLLLAADPLSGLGTIIFNRSAWVPDLLPVAEIEGRPACRTRAAQTALGNAFAHYVERYVAAHKRVTA
jgi:hypothetical protein